MPRIRIRDASNVLRTVRRIRMRDASNVLRTIRRVRIRDASNVLRVVYTAFSAIVTPTIVSGSTDLSTLEDVTTNSATALTSGGTAPYTYAWTLLSSDGFISWTIDSPTTAATTFTANDVPGSMFTIATFQVEITDDTGEKAYATVTATAENTNTS